MAPELFRRGAKFSKEADMWAFGMVVYEVVTGARPFGRRNSEIVVFGARPNTPEDPVAVGFGQGTWEFAERCWDANWEQRPTAAEALEHFGRVAGTSTVVDPGATIREVPSSLGSISSRNSCEYRKLGTVSIPDNILS